MNDKMYAIEKKGPDYYGAYEYRFYSLFNGARGGWFFKKEDAVREAERHEEILKKFFQKEYIPQ